MSAQNEVIEKILRAASLDDAEYLLDIAQRSFREGYDAACGTLRDLEKRAGEEPIAMVFGMVAKLLEDAKPPGERI